MKHRLRFLVFPSGVAGVSGRSSGAGEFLLLSSPVTEGPAADTPSTDTEAADSADDVVLDEEVVLVEMLEALASVLSDLGTVTVGLPVSVNQTRGEYEEHKDIIRGIPNSHYWPAHFPISHQFQPQSFISLCRASISKLPIKRPFSHRFPQKHQLTAC